MPDRPMRHFLKAFLALTLSAGFATAVAAQEDPFMPGVIGAEQGMSGIDFDSARMSFFNQADLNGDLVLSPDEMNQAMAHGGSRLFQGQDIDGNGQMTLDEYLQSGNDLFQSLDTDGDGVLSSGEM
jgi:hypothetical protein